LNQFPEEYAKLRANPDLIAKMVPEIIRYQSPVVHMRHAALRDAELSGKRIRKGEKVAMWYISGNRDPEEIEEPDRFIIDRHGPASICLSRSIFIAASATAWRRCS
jgi:cytochrome P450